MLEPVAGERFDLVVSQPAVRHHPAASAGVPATSTATAAGRATPSCATWSTGVGAVLAPGGVAQLLGNWEVRRGEDWHERVGAWVDASGLDALGRPARGAGPRRSTPRRGSATAARRPTATRAAWAAALRGLARRLRVARRRGHRLRHRHAAPARSTGAPTLRRLEEVTGPVRQPLGPAPRRRPRRARLARARSTTTPSPPRT